MDNIKTILALSAAVLIAVALVGCLHERTNEETRYVTDPVIAHLPVRANLSFPDAPTLNQTVNIAYTLTPSVDLKLNVSDGIVLPEEIVFVENNLPTGQITLLKNKTYPFNATIKAVKTGEFIIYASPGIYVDATVLRNTQGAIIHEPINATVPLFLLRSAKKPPDILMTVSKNWLQEYGVREYEKEELKCSILTFSHDLLCCVCEMNCYSDSTLYDRYYFVIEDRLNANKIKIKNVYRWMYWSPSGYQSEPVCEEITAAVLTEVAVTGSVIEKTEEKTEYVTDPVIAHIPVTAHLDFFGLPELNQTIEITYSLTPSVDLRTNVSAGLVLPEEIVFVENNLPAEEITLSKGETYEFDAKIKGAKTGEWTIYVSPGVHAYVKVSNDTPWAVTGKIRDATEPRLWFEHRPKVSEEQRNTFRDTAKNWVREHGYEIREYEKEEVNCSILSTPDKNIRSWGCEMKWYANSTLYERYYIILEEDTNTHKTKIMNVYRWAYWSPSGYQAEPVCEEITQEIKPEYPKGKIIDTEGGVIWIPDLA